MLQFDKLKINSNFITVETEVKLSNPPHTQSFFFFSRKKKTFITFISWRYLFNSFLF